MICILIAHAQTSSPSFISDSLDAYISQGLKNWNIPGISIAINRSKASLRGFMAEQNESVKSTRTLPRVRANNPPLNLESYTGTYENEIYGPVAIEKDKQGKGLLINFKGHNNLTSNLQYMDHDEWLLTYNNLAYGIFPIKFKSTRKKIASADLRVNEFIDYDSYNFIKK